MGRAPSTDKIRDIILDSQDIKKVLCEKVREYGVSMKRLCIKHGIDYYDFRARYLNTKRRVTQTDITQQKVLDLFADVGIDIKIHVVLRGIDPEKLKENLKQYSNN